MSYGFCVTVIEKQQETPPRISRATVLDAFGALCRFGLAIVWIAGGVTKIGDRMAVTQSIAAYEIFTPYWSDILAQLIGPLEIAGGLFLLVGLWLRPSAKLSAVVMVLFIIGLSQAWARGLEIDCGCFSPQSDEPSTDYLSTILRDVVFVAMSLYIVYRPFKKWAIYP